MLGLGLGINKSNRVQTSLELLLKYTSAMWLPSKATGTSEGINSPFTNPLIDLKGVVGKNLIDVSQQHAIGSISPATGIDFTSGNKIRPVGFVSVVQNTQYTFNFLNGYRCSYLYFYDQSGLFISSLAVGTTIVTFTTPTNCYKLRYIVQNASDTNIGSPLEIFTASPQLELGSVATAYEPYGKANLLLQGFAGTTSSGYVGVLCPNGKTVPFLKFDAVDDLGIANHPSLDITGTGTFYFGNVIRTSALVTQYFNIKAEQSEATTQYGLKLTNTGVLSIILEGTNIQLSTGLLADTNYNAWVQRESGVLKCYINNADTEVFSVANITSLTSRPNFRWGALSTNVGGTTHTGFANVNLGASVIGITDATKARVSWFKFTMQTFGI